MVIEGRTGVATPCCTLGERLAPLVGDRRFDLSLLHRYRLEQRPDGREPWAGVTVGYHYHLFREDGTELIRFEWHPYNGLVSFPHIHVRGQDPGRIITHRTHIPSGPVSLAAVVRFAIEELGVRPLRPDWAAILDDE